MDTKRLCYYSQLFNMGEMDSTFYDRFHSQMTKGRFIGMVRATPEIFQFSIKVPETISHVKELDVKKWAITFFEGPNKLGAILFQLPPSFTVNELKIIGQFLDRLPTADRYDYAIEFRQPSWGSEGPWEILEPLQYRGLNDWFSSKRISNIYQM